MKGAIIPRLKKEIHPWNRISELLSQSTPPEENDTHHNLIASLCPFCNKSNIRVELMEGVNMFNDEVKIGFFTCTSCGQDWSNRIGM